MTKTNEKVEGLDLLRLPFAENHISKLPKPTKAQTDAVKADFKAGRRCTICGAWHHPDVVHLDYVGHAALTDRLLDADIMWTWEPMAFGGDGLPALDRNGGMWIRLTVCGVTRIGYGSADGKSGGDAIKEVIGDALRNAGMRFGAALDLWHKGDLHASEPEAPANDERKTVAAESNNPAPEQPSLYKRLSVANSACADKAAFNNLWGAPATIKAQSSLSVNESTWLEKEKVKKFAELEVNEPSDYVPPSFDDLPEPTQQAVKNLGA